MENENKRTEILAVVKRDILQAIEQSDVENIVTELNEAFNAAKQTALSKVSRLLLNSLDSY